MMNFQLCHMTNSDVGCNVKLTQRLVVSLQRGPLSMEALRNCFIKRNTRGQHLTALNMPLGSFTWDIMAHLHPPFRGRCQHLQLLLSSSSDKFCNFLTPKQSELETETESAHCYSLCIPTYNAAVITKTHRRHRIPN